MIEIIKQHYLSILVFFKDFEYRHPKTTCVLIIAVILSCIFSWIALILSVLSPSSSNSFISARVFYAICLLASIILSIPFAAFIAVRSFEKLYSFLQKENLKRLQNLTDAFVKISEIFKQRPELFAIYKKEQLSKLLVGYGIPHTLADSVSDASELDDTKQCYSPDNQSICEILHISEADLLAVLKTFAITRSTIRAQALILQKYTDFPAHIKDRERTYASRPSIKADYFLALSNDIDFRLWSGNQSSMTDHQRFGFADHMPKLSPGRPKNSNSH